MTYALLYLVNIIFFTLMYWCFFDNAFKDIESLSPLQTLYFSVITVTTLGYGDITPDLNSNGLLLTIISQVSSGILLIGLFLNSIAQKLSDIKDEKTQKEERKEEKILLSKQMALFKPIIEDHLKILSEIYSVTSTVSSKNFHIYPSEFFNTEYYDTVCRLNFFTKTYKVQNGIQLHIYWAEYLMKEYNNFVEKIDNFLFKFSTTLPINMIEVLIQIQKSIYITFPANEISFKNLFESQGITHSTALETGLTLEHSNSSLELPEDEKTVKNYHELLLLLIEIIDNSLPEDKVQIFIRLDSRYPGIGSAISEIAIEK